MTDTISPDCSLNSKCVHKIECEGIKSEYEQCMEINRKYYDIFQSQNVEIVTQEQLVKKLSDQVETLTTQKKQDGEANAIYYNIIESQKVEAAKNRKELDAQDQLTKKLTEQVENLITQNRNLKYHAGKMIQKYKSLEYYCRISGISVDPEDIKEIGCCSITI